MKKRPDQEFKDYAVKLVVEEGRKMTDVGHELNISSSSLGRWKKDYLERVNPSEEKETHYTPSEVAAMKKKHEKEMAAMKTENEILKKAMHYFTKDHE
ncbi:transposase [Paenalkalicoccus suaedae]|uniref:Transposase n=1 Tax=Paenalkalicoccus suaedae TaxID=2592382 RepID=A0A859FCK6_9BACI|nr:transposase [Paenalkalicoccus suaedae]QKS70568.1 transposase [Paenalkalicoccus suaedae]